MTDTARADFGPDSAALCSPEAEEAVLGCVLINPDAYFEVAPFLAADDFHLHRHRWIWDAFVRLNDQRLPVDLITVSEVLQRRRQLEEAGGAAYLTRLINTVPTSLHVEAYGRIVQRSTLRRRLLEAASAVARLAYEEDRDIDEIVGDAEAAVSAVSARAVGSRGASLAEAASACSNEVEQLSSGAKEMPGLPVGLRDLDAVLGGLQESDLIIVAGRPGTGKSSFMLGAVRNAAKHGRRAALFSLEMARNQIVQRLIAQETGIDAHRLRLGRLRDGERPRFASAVQALSAWPVHLFGPGEAVTPAEVCAHCRRMAQADGLDLVVVDYLQLLRGDGKFPNREQEVASLSRSLKLLAGELNVPVLVGAQLSRAPEQRADRRPILSDLRESGSQEQDADVVLFVHPLDDETTQLIVAKQRNGPTHPGIELKFDKGACRFRQPETR